MSPICSMALTMVYLTILLVKVLSCKSFPNGNFLPSLIGSPVSSKMMPAEAAQHEDNGRSGLSEEGAPSVRQRMFA